MRISVKPRVDTEKAIRQWLRDHYDVIGRVEALDLGLTRSRIDGRLRRQEWAVAHLGVYRDAAAPRSPYQALRAGYLATGGAGVVSHASAASVWGLLSQWPATPELTVHPDAHHGPGRDGLIIHRSKDLDPLTVVHRNTILVTNPLRTLVDLAGCVSPTDLTRAVDVALATGLVSVEGLEAEIQRRARQGRNGVGAMRRHLASRGFIGAPSASVLEAHLRRLVLSLGLATPTVEVRVGKNGKYRLDLAWCQILFAVEVDGYVWHFSPEQQQRDLTRRNRLQEQGWTIRVYTWQDILDEPGRVGKEILATYRRLGGPIGR
jgi:very-short-patch-repair endonuclease